MSQSIILKSMKKNLLLATFLLYQLGGLSQTKPQKLEDVCQVFHLPDGKDTTTFIVFGTKGDLKIKKPLFFFRQGSLPMPLVGFYDAAYSLHLLPFSYKPYQNDYHFVMVKKNGTPLVADSTYMAALSEGTKTSNSRFFTKKYLANNNLDKATQQCNQVIKFFVAHV